ncbi:MAG: gliding motility protein GldN, partial [Bacteroidaceae bacterium]|nr:gliding motility protein GldN [Bacteroidaceae bacterium]
MKRIVQAAFALILAFNFSLLTSQAQPQKTRVQTTTSRNANATRTTGTNRNAAGKQGDPKVSRASIMFPTAVAVPEEVPWRRDVYRSLDLTKDENAALYYPVEPQGNDVNLFTLLFRLLNTGTIPAYEYKLDGVEDFSQANRMHFKDMLDRFSIFYEIDGRSIKVADADVPSSEVLSIYVKESSYYDQNTATYHSRVVALCPVLHRADDFSMDQRKYPMFWVKIEDIEPYLSQRMVMTSNLNNAARMSMADFFATNHYKGDIYMTTNMQGKSLQDQVNARQQQQIEEEYVDSAALRQTTALQNEQKRI